MDIALFIYLLFILSCPLEDVILSRINNIAIFTRNMLS